MGDRLLRVREPLGACRDPNASHGSHACSDALESLRNPFWIEDEPGAFHTTGWLDAFDSEPSPFAVAAESASDIATAVRFARERRIPLVVKGTGHDYLGRSSSPESLLIWTHHMRNVKVHDSFTPAGAGKESAAPAISVGAGVRWIEACRALSGTRYYVQGGGCTSVGAAGGFTLGGGFGSFSRRFGTAAGNVLELEVVTADGEIVVASANQNPDLFWALRGGGGGTFGIVARVTFRTHRAPESMTAAAGSIRSKDTESFRSLLGMIVRLVPDLCDDHWGEQIRLSGDNSVELSMIAADVDDSEAQDLWRPLMDWVARHSDAFDSDAFVATGPFELGSFWDARSWAELMPEMIRQDERPGSPAGMFWWAANQEEVSQYVEAYKSRWIPLPLFEESPDVAADALFEASRHWRLSLHFNKALAGASADATERDRTTSINPAVFEAACLAISASSQHAYPGVPGHEPNRRLAADRARRVDGAMAPIRELTPGSGSYANEADYFEPEWQRSAWGDNYERLLEIKQKYDPDNVFCVHHGVGSS